MPLFFMVSGYYLRRDDMTNAQVHERMCLKVKRFGGLLLNDFTAIGGHLWFIAALLCCYGLFRYAGCKWLDKCGGSVAAILLGVHIVGRGVLAIRGRGQHRRHTHVHVAARRRVHGTAVRGVGRLDKAQSGVAD